MGGEALPINLESRIAPRLRMYQRLLLKFLRNRITCSNFRLFASKNSIDLVRNETKLTLRNDLSNRLVSWNAKKSMRLFERSFHARIERNANFRFRLTSNISKQVANVGTFFCPIKIFFANHTRILGKQRVGLQNWNFFAFTVVLFGGWVWVSLNYFSVVFLSGHNWNGCLQPSADILL